MHLLAKEMYGTSVNESIESLYIYPGKCTPLKGTLINGLPTIFILITFSKIPV